MKGTVKSFDPLKGFGEIQKEDGSDIFVDVSDIKGATKLLPGEDVEFEIRQTARGQSAINVTVLATELPSKRKRV